MSKLTGLIDRVQETIDRGSTTVEEVHKAIMNQPLDLIERIPPLEGAARSVREVQNRTVGSVYDIIRTTNRQVGNLARDLLSKAERPHDG